MAVRGAQLTYGGSPGLSRPQDVPWQLSPVRHRINSSCHCDRRDRIAEPPSFSTVSVESGSSCRPHSPKLRCCRKRFARRA